MRLSHLDLLHHHARRCGYGVRLGSGAFSAPIDFFEKGVLMPDFGSSVVRTAVVRAAELGTRICRPPTRFPTNSSP